jgi:hypothetical protein
VVDHSRDVQSPGKPISSEQITGQPAERCSVLPMPVEEKTHIAGTDADTLNVNKALIGEDDEASLDADRRARFRCGYGFTTSAP